MGTSVFGSLWTSCLLILGTALVVSLVGERPAAARQAYLDGWEALYCPDFPADCDSFSGENADCQLCHETTASSSWNGYGWNFFQALDDVLPDVETCDGPDEGTDVSIEEAFLCIELLDSDEDIAGGFLNIEEIFESTQPGWTEGAFNTIYSRGATDLNQLPPDNIGPLDPDGAGGTGGMGGVGGTGGMGGTGGDEMFPPGQYKRRTQVVVYPGQSIQEAIDRAQPGARIYVLAGDYTEPNNPTNGLNITKSGIHLIGQTNSQKRVRLLPSPGQRNGIVIVPPDVAAAAQPQGRVVESRTDCMGCHTDMGPPFPLHPDVPKYIPMDTDPYIYDIRVESITIEGFENNGIWTEMVDGLVFDDLESINNRNYGIFPVLSKNGVITNCRSVGSDKDSGLWVETSERFLVQGNVVEDSVNGIEVSNSDDILVIDNEMTKNTVGAAILLLPDIYENKDSAKRIHLVNNWIHNNNRPNTARPGSILSFIPSGMGILYVGVDESLISGNLVENNDFVGVAVVDYCLPFVGIPNFQCPPPFGIPDVPSDPFITDDFLSDQSAANNSVVGNVLLNNGTNPDPEHPFYPFAADISLLTFDNWGNCFENNDYETWFSTLGDPPGILPPCQ